MASGAKTFRLQIMSLRRVLFDGDVEEVHIWGDEGEYDLLPYHYPIMGAIPEGDIVINRTKKVPLRVGVLLFNNNRCIIIIEEKGPENSEAVSAAESKPAPAN